tara:strand:+ start:5719 stop:6342 length:624 start_codon:yes stop_codon:yes gene_type:complete
MANIIDRLPQKGGTGTTKANYTEIGLGNDKGAIYFGHIHEKGDVTADIALLTHDGKHFMCMDGDGQRKGWTSFACPGNFSVEAGEKNKKIDSTIMINSKNGDIQIIATDGNIRMEANNFEFIARGEGGSAGNVTFTATESFVIKDTKKILMDCSSFFSLSSTGTGEVVAKSCLNIYGSIIKGVTDAVAIKGAKNTNRKFWEKKNPNA